ncbi:EthD domain-containing protein [Zhongshania sp.]|uniref:EthD domain-containing protein n=1 Tax=Zhongshania sp. TaxID=1971902 RepID=UPI003566C95C
MRKVIYLMWTDTPGTEFEARLLSWLAPELRAQQGVRGVQLNIVDAAVAPAVGLRMENSAQGFDAMCSLYLDESAELAVLQEYIQSCCVQFSRYHVDEFEPLANTSQLAGLGERTPGFSQVAMLRCPQSMAYEDWLAYWRGVHTQIAIDVQASFRYVQNVVSELAGNDVTCYHAIVEECFPAEAMTSSEAFYNAVGDQEKFERHLQKMMESCQKFIDFDEIDVVQTSEYRF